MGSANRSAFNSCEKAQRRLALYCLPVLSRSLVITDTRPFTVALATIFKRMGQNNSKVKQMRSLLENSQTVGRVCGTLGSHHQASFGVGRTLFFLPKQIPVITTIFPHLC